MKLGSASRSVTSLQAERARARREGGMGWVGARRKVGTWRATRALGVGVREVCVYTCVCICLFERKRDRDIKRDECMRGRGI